MVTGGAGSIGSEISKQLFSYNPRKIIILDHSEFNIYRFNQKLTDKKIKLVLGDIKDPNKKLFIKIKLIIFFIQIAYKHVKFLEENILSAVKNNILGTHSILKVIQGKKSKFVFISID